MYIKLIVFCFHEDETAENENLCKLSTVDQVDHHFTKERYLAWHVCFKNNSSLKIDLAIFLLFLLCIVHDRSLSDPRTEELVAGRSINLSLSERGIESLKRVGVDAEVLY